MTADNGRHAGARIGANGPERRVSTARLQSTRRWLEQIVATLPEPRQRMYDLFVARGLDSRRAALELGTGVAEVRRLRRENRDAVLRAFEVTALAADAAQDEPGSEAPGCGELRQIMAGARDDDAHEATRRPFVVLPAALRVIVVRHLSQCATCQDRGDDCMAAWAPELLSIMGDAERHEQVMAETRSMQEPGQRGPVPGAHRRAGTARNVVVRRAATGAGLLTALPLLAFVWPGFLHGQQAHQARSPQAFANSAQSSTVAPQVTGTGGEVAGSSHGQTASRGTSGSLSRLSPTATGSMTAQPYASPQPSVYYTLPPVPSPTPSLGQPTAVASPTRVPTSPSPSPSPRKSKKPSPTPSPVTSTTPTSPATPTASPTPSAAPSTPAPTTSSSPAPSSPDPTASASDPAASAASPSPTATPTDSATS